VRRTRRPPFPDIAVHARARANADNGSDRPPCPPTDPARDSLSGLARQWIRLDPSGTWAGFGKWAAEQGLSDGQQHDLRVEVLRRRCFGARPRRRT
jgi:hypothetical protein